jgi:hypothetical protein
MPPPDKVPRTIPGFLRYMFVQLVTRRRWILLPLWILLALIGLLLLLSGNSALLPGIYIGF